MKNANWGRIYVVMMLKRAGDNRRAGDLVTARRYLACARRGLSTDGKGWGVVE